MATDWTGITSNKNNTSNAPLVGLRMQTTDPNNSVLYQWGPLQFKVWPLNIHEFDHETDTDWAQKEIAGAAIYREWVGENDEVLYFRGKLFPYRIGGMAEIEIFEANRRAGLAQLLMRGGNPSFKLGWFVCEKLVRANTFLSGEGLGQQIAFETQLARVPTPQYQESAYRDGVQTGWIGLGNAGIDALQQAADAQQVAVEAAKAAAEAAAEAAAREAVSQAAGSGGIANVDIGNISIVPQQ